jgi:hypothetical protein
LHRQLFYVLDCDAFMSSLCFNLQDGHVILALRSVCVWFFEICLWLCLIFKISFYFFWGVYLCLGGLLSFVCIFFEGMSTSLGFCILSSVCLCFQLMYVCICVFEYLCLSLKVYVCLCFWRSLGVYVFKVCVSLFVSLNAWVKLELKVHMPIRG